MVSDQIAGGLYFTPGNFKINVEGWYKTMDGMLAYNGANAFYPPLVNWEKSFTSGSGKSYGLELETTYSIPNKLELSAYYTLSWSWRQFDAYYMFPFLDRNDNRHKVNLVGNWNFARGWFLSFNWSWHTGNRITLPSHIIRSESGSYDTVYESPFNAKLPDYHRLDISLDRKWVLFNGNIISFNLSVYNVYNHLNASFAMLDQDEKGNYRGMAYGLIPIIPTLSVGYKF